MKRRKHSINQSIKHLSLAHDTESQNLSVIAWNQNFLKYSPSESYSVDWNWENYHKNTANFPKVIFL